MDWQETPAFIAVLSSRQGMAAKAPAFLILTATRSAETRAATWAEIDMQAAVWTVPASRMKAAREQRIPLAGAALSILQAVLPDNPDPAELIFPGARGHKPLSDVALAKLLPPNVTCHGFRSSFRTWAGEQITYAREVVEMAVAHRLRDAVEQAYARGDLFQRRRCLMAEWAAYCVGEAPVDSRVVEFAGARA
jgi:integrase